MIASVVVFSILIWSSLEDLARRKFSNRMFLICFCSSLLTSLAAAAVRAPQSNVWPFLTQTLGLLGLQLLLALFLMVPLHISKVIAAGDVKIFVSIAPLLAWNQLHWVLILSLIWGAVFGLLKALRGQQLRSVFVNTISVMRRRPPPATELHQIPFAVALLMGWLTFFSFWGHSWS